MLRCANIYKNIKNVGSKRIGGKYTKNRQPNVGKVLSRYITNRHIVISYMRIRHVYRNNKHTFNFIKFNNILLYTFNKLVIKKVHQKVKKISSRQTILINNLTRLLFRLNSHVNLKGRSTNSYTQYNLNIFLKKTPPKLFNSIYSSMAINSLTPIKHLKYLYLQENSNQPILLLKLKLNSSNRHNYKKLSIVIVNASKSGLQILKKRFIKYRVESFIFYEGYKTHKRLKISRLLKISNVLGKLKLFIDLMRLRRFDLAQILQDTVGYRESKNLKDLCNNRVKSYYSFTNMVIKKKTSMFRSLDLGTNKTRGSTYPKLFTGSGNVKTKVNTKLVSILYDKPSLGAKYTWKKNIIVRNKFIKKRKLIKIKHFISIPTLKCFNIVLLNKIVNSKKILKTLNMFKFIGIQIRLKTINFLIKKKNKKKKIFKKKKFFTVKKTKRYNHKAIRKLKFLFSKHRLSVIFFLNNYTYNVKYTKNIYNNLFLNKHSVKSFYINFYLKSKDTKIALKKKKKKKTFFFNFWKKKLTVFKNARNIHWNFFQKKLNKKRRYKNYLQLFLKKPEKNLKFILNFLVIKFKFSFIFWEQFTHIYNTLYKKSIDKKSVYQLPISQLFWIFLKKNQRNKLKIKKKIKKYIKKNKKIKKKFWMKRKKNIPPFFTKQIYFINTISNVQYDFITNYFCIIRNQTKQKLHNQLYDNNLIRLHDFRYKA